MLQFSTIPAAIPEYDLFAGPKVATLTPCSSCMIVAKIAQALAHWPLPTIKILAKSKGGTAGGSTLHGVHRSALRSLKASGTPLIVTFWGGSRKFSVGPYDVPFNLFQAVGV